MGPSSHIISAMGAFKRSLQLSQRFALIVIIGLTAVLVAAAPAARRLKKVRPSERRFFSFSFSGFDSSFSFSSFFTPTFSSSFFSSFYDCSSEDHSPDLYCDDDDGGMEAYAIALIVFFVVSFAVGLAIGAFCYWKSRNAVTVEPVTAVTVVQPVAAPQQVVVIQPVPAPQQVVQPIPMKQETGGFCGACGNTLAPGAGFCPGCGAATAAAPPPPAMQAAPIAMVPSGAAAPAQMLQPHAQQAPPPPYPTPQAPPPPAPTGGIVYN